MTTEERNRLLEGWLKDIEKVARRAANDWPGIVEQDDMVQDVCLHILESPGTQRDLAEMDDNHRYQTLHKIAQRIASKERNSYEYFSGQFRYSVNEIRRALEAGALRAIGSGLKSSWSAEDYVSNGSDHSDTVLDMVSMEQDLRVALARVEDTNEDYYEVLVRRYVEGEFGMSDADQKRLQRAVESLTTRMNHAHKAPTFRVESEQEYHPTTGWDTYYGASAARAEYEEALSEIHEPTPELMLVGPDGLGIPNIKRGAR